MSITLHQHSSNQHRMCVFLSINALHTSNCETQAGEEEGSHASLQNVIENKFSTAWLHLFQGLQQQMTAPWSHWRLRLQTLQAVSLLGFLSPPLNPPKSPLQRECWGSSNKPFPMSHGAKVPWDTRSAFRVGRSGWKDLLFKSIVLFCLEELISERNLLPLYPGKGKQKTNKTPSSW